MYDRAQKSIQRSRRLTENLTAPKIVAPKPKPAFGFASAVMVTKFSGKMAASVRRWATASLATTHRRSYSII